MIQGKTPLRVGLPAEGMAYEVEYHRWEVWEHSKKLQSIFYAEITADTMDEIGSAVDEVEKKWGNCTRMRGIHDARRVEEEWKEFRSDMPDSRKGVYSFGNQVHTPTDPRVAPHRVKGRWIIFWGKIE